MTSQSCHKSLQALAKIVGSYFLRRTPEQGLCLIDDLLTREELDNYSLAYSARADLCRRLGRLPEARASYEKALSLARQEPERRFLSGRLEELKEKTGDAVDFLSAPTTIG